MSALRTMAAGEAEPAEIDPAIFDAINELIAELAARGSIEKEAAEVLRDNYNRLAERIAGVINVRGHSFVEERKTKEYHKLLRQAGEHLSAGRLRQKLLAYQNTSWLRDRGGLNPYAEFDPRYLYFRILTIRDHVPSETWLRKILN